MNCGHCDRTTEAFLCWECTRTLRDSFERIPWLAEQLDVAATRQHKFGSSVRGRSDEVPLPFNDAASRLRTHLHDALVRWVRDLCDSRGIEFIRVDRVPADFVGPLLPDWRREDDTPVTTDDLAQWLAENAVAIMHSEDAALCWAEIAHPKGGIVAQAETLINRPDPPVYRGPCPTIIGADHRDRPTRCGVDLYAGREDDFASCPRCKTQHDIRKLEQRLLDEINDRLMTGVEIRRVMRELREPVPESTFFHWRDTKRIQPRGWMHDGRITDHFIHRNDPPVFRLGDVRALRKGDHEEARA